MEYVEFKVHVKNENERSIILSADTPSIDFEIVHDPLYARIIDIFNKWLKENDEKSKTQEYVKTFGTVLFRVIFNDKMEEYFRSSYNKIRKDPNKVLRVILEFEKKAEKLAIWPWEYIYLPDSDVHGSGFFLAADDKIVMARQVPLKIEDLEKSNSLNILIIKSTPSKTDNENEDDPGIIVSDEIIKKIEMLKEWAKGKVNIEILETPTKEKLKNKIESEYKQGRRYQIVHFIGHGKYIPSNQNKEEGGYLGFTKKDHPDIISWLSESAFAECFKNKEPRLIFLHACDGAASQSYDTFRGIALQLVFSRIPGVIAMQYPVTNLVAIRFAKKFYESLCQGNDIDVAVQAGRLEIGWYSDESQNFTNRDFGSPVVYLQKEDGLIIASSDDSGIIDDKNEKEELPDFIPDKCPVCKIDHIIEGQVRCSNPSCRAHIIPCPKCHKPYSESKGFCIYCDYETDRDKIQVLSEKSESGARKGGSNIPDKPKDRPIKLADGLINQTGNLP